jgi:hypothetical protein
MFTTKTISWFLRGLSAAVVLCSAVLYLDSAFNMTSKNAFYISSQNKTTNNVTGSMRESSKHETTDSTRSRRIVLYTGNASSWQPLSDEDLSIYFTPAEISGLETQSCGDVNNASSPWQWQGNIPGASLHLGSGPCCPNGHTYGWFSAPLQDTTPLRKVEVASNEQLVGPLQIQALLTVLNQQQRRFQQQKIVTDSLDSNATRPSAIEPSASTTYRIWILGDSTSNQLFYGFLCAIIRIGGAVEICQMLKQSHYAHPLCQLIPNAKKDDLNTTTVDNVDHQSVILALPDGRGRIELHHFPDGNFCYIQPPNKQSVYCRAHDARFLNLAQETLLPPDLFLVNLGVHKRTQGDLEMGMQAMLALLSPFLKSVIWRSTGITHFPSVDSSGIFEDYQRDRGSGRINATSCQDIVFNETGQWRQQVAHQWLANNYGNETANQTRIPILNMNETEAHMFETYGGAQESGKVDCTHHIYTPLYYDSFFWRLSQLLLLERQQQQRKAWNRRSTRRNKQ